MSTIAVPSRFAILPVEQDRGTYGMLLAILTEAFLFIALFSSYFVLAANKDRWRIEELPKLHYALPMLALLLASSLVLHWGERQQERQRGGAMIGLALTIVMGLVFLILQAFEYTEHWRTLTPTTDSYGSIFYAITTFHAAHVIVGLLILTYVLFLPRQKAPKESPYRPYHVAALYWHFVDFIWILVVAILYVGPHL